jgi:hypothetical protein
MPNMPDWLINGTVQWLLAHFLLAALKTLWGLLAQTAFSTPDVTTLPQVTTLSGTSLMVVNTCFVLVIVTAGLIVMTRETLQTRYGLGELAPRLVVAFIATNMSAPICSTLIGLGNAFTQTMTGDTLASQGSFQQLYRTVNDAMSQPANALLTLIIGVIIAVLTAMLLVAWLLRLGVLIILVTTAPIALACHALPQLDGLARLWWRAMLAVLGIVVLQALALHTALVIFINPGANIPDLGLPQDPSGTFNLLIIACLLWAVLKIPAMMRRYVTHGGAGHNVAGVMVRMLVVQHLAKVLRMPLRRTGSGGGGRVAAAAGGGHGGGGPGGGGSRPPQPLGGGSPAPASQGQPPRPGGAGRGRVGVAWPTGRPVRPYTPTEVASGVDPYTRTVAKRSAPPAPQPPPATHPPIRAAGVQPAPPPSRPAPVIPAGVDPATAMPKTRPLSPPVKGPWNTPTRRR